MSIIDVTFATKSMALRIKSWKVNELYAHSDHHAITFEVYNYKYTRKQRRWNTRSLDKESFIAVMESNNALQGNLDDMAQELMSQIVDACVASMIRHGIGKRHSLVY